MVVFAPTEYETRERDVLGGRASGAAGERESVGRRGQAGLAELARTRMVSGDGAGAGKPGTRICGMVFKFSTLLLYEMSYRSTKVLFTTWYIGDKTMTKKQSKKRKKAVDGKMAAANDKPKSEVTLSKKAISARTAGVKLFAMAGRPSHADFRKVFGATGPVMTWSQLAEKLGIPSAEECAEKFQSLLEAVKKGEK